MENGIRSVSILSAKKNFEIVNPYINRWPILPRGVNATLIVADGCDFVTSILGPTFGVTIGKFTVMHLLFKSMRWFWYSLNC